MNNQIVKRTVKISSITVDSRIQQRWEINKETIQEYQEAIELAGGKWPFPPVAVFRDGEGGYLLADGFHRIEATQDSELEKVPMEIHPGDREDAILFAVGANSTHGLPRTNADKARAVNTLLEHPEWSTWSNRDIAERAGVSHPFVGRLRDAVKAGKSPQLETVTSCPEDSHQLETLPVEPKPSIKPVIRKGKDGRVRDVSKIQEANRKRAVKTKTTLKPTPKKAALQSVHRFGGACQDLRKVKLSGGQKFEIAERCRDTLFWCLPDLKKKDRAAMVEKICSRAGGA